jgi:hypothetical protein
MIKTGKYAKRSEKERTGQKREPVDAHVFFVGTITYNFSENLRITLALYDGRRGKW